VAKKQEGSLLVEIASLLPWWVDIGVGVGGFFGCRWLGDTFNPSTSSFAVEDLQGSMLRTIVYAGALVVMWIIPIAFGVGAVMSVLNRRKAKAVKKPQIPATQTVGVGGPVSRSTPNRTAAKLSASPACPLCSKQMLERTAKRGATPGSKFWGCSSYPVCRGIRDI
jgi:Topoisomerase DNA binding C4 zinc finger